MSDRTQGSVRTEGQVGGSPSGSAAGQADAATAAIPPEGSSGATTPADAPGGGKPGRTGKAGPTTTAPGWGGATPAKPGGPGTSQTQAARPAGSPPARPTAPAATSGKPAAKGPAKPAGKPARSGAPQTGARPANRDSAGAPRSAGGRPPAGAPANGRVPDGQGRPAGIVGPTPDGDGGARTSTKGRGPRRARLQLRHIDTWSALKISLVLSIALFFVWMVAVGVLYGVLNSLGVFSTLNELIGQLGSSSGDAAASDVITPGIVFGGAAVIGGVNVVLFTALCTVGTFIYNLCSDLVGGLELTLSERD